MTIPKRLYNSTQSLSARRAWIEMSPEPPEPIEKSVALRKESVDRNAQRLPAEQPGQKSLSARRAWIEILNSGVVICIATCRSPQGERG
mgnify:CR=1 FL=1